MQQNRFSAKSWPMPFKEAFCQAFRCEVADYERRIFWLGLYRHALPAAALIYPINRDFFREDFDLIREIGIMSDADTFRAELNFFHGRNFRDRNPFRRTLSIRLSARRLIAIRNRVFSNPLLTAALC